MRVDVIFLIIFIITEWCRCHANDSSDNSHLEWAAALHFVRIALISCGVSIGSVAQASASTTLPSPSAATPYSYGDALTKSLLFYESQRSGVLNQRYLAWYSTPTISSHVILRVRGGWQGGGLWEWLDGEEGAEAFKEEGYESDVKPAWKVLWEEGRAEM